MQDTENKEALSPNFGVVEGLSSEDTETLALDQEKDSEEKCNEEKGNKNCLIGEGAPQDSQAQPLFDDTQEKTFEGVLNESARTQERSTDSHTLPDPHEFTLSLAQNNAMREKNSFNARMDKPPTSFSKLNHTLKQPISATKQQETFQNHETLQKITSKNDAIIMQEGRAHSDSYRSNLEDNSCTMDSQDKDSQKSIGIAETTGFMPMDSSLATQVQNDKGVFGQAQNDRGAFSQIQNDKVVFSQTKNNNEVFAAQSQSDRDLLIQDSYNMDSQDRNSKALMDSSLATQVQNDKGVFATQSKNDRDLLNQGQNNKDLLNQSQDDKDMQKQVLYNTELLNRDSNNTNSNNMDSNTTNSRNADSYNIVSNIDSHAPMVYSHAEPPEAQNTKQEEKQDKQQDKSQEESQDKPKHNPIMRLTLFFAIVLVLIIVGYKILANGISLERLEFGRISIHNVFLQLQNKLILTIDKVDLGGIAESQSKEDVTKPFSESFQGALSAIQRTLYALSYFERLQIQELKLPNDMQWRIDYTNANYRVSGTLFDADFAIHNRSNAIAIHINTFTFNTLPIRIEGDITYSIPKKELLFDCQVIHKPNEKERLTLKGATNFQTISAQASSTPFQNLQFIKPLIDGIQSPELRQTLQDWIYNNIEYENVRLSNLSVSLNLDNIGETLLRSMRAEIIVENPKVKLAKNLTPIYAAQTILTFQDKSLKIVPIQATFAGMDLSGSEVVIANMPQSDFILELNGQNVRFDSHLAKLVAHYGVTLPISQQSLKQAKGTANKATQPQQDTKAKPNASVLVQQAINNTEERVTRALNTQQQLQNANALQPQVSKHTALENTTQDSQTDSQMAQSGAQDSQTTQDSKNTQKLNNDGVYAKILELNPETTLTSDLLNNPNHQSSTTTGKEATSMHLKITIAHNKKASKKPLFSLQGIIQAQHTSLNLYEIPLRANKLNVALDITPSQKLVYINGERVKWQRLVDADVNVLLDINKQNIRANTYIHKAILNTANLKDLSLVPNAPSTTPIKKTKIIQNLEIDSNTMANSGIYFDPNNFNYSGFDYSSTPTKTLGFHDYAIVHVNAKNTTQNSVPTWEHSTSTQSHKLLEDARKQQLQNRELAPEVIKNLPKKDIKDDGKSAKEDDHVLKDLRNNPVWNDLKFHSKKTQPFQKKSTKELTELAQKLIEQERDSFSLEQDFFNIANANIHLNLSFANDTLTLDVPALSLHLESSKNLNFKITKIENILQFSPLARYYGITHGDFSLSTTPYSQAKGRIDFTLNLTNLLHPLYTISNKRVSDLSLKGHIQDGSVIVFVNDDIDFKSQDSLSMLRMKGYKINVDEAMQSQIPFFVDLFKDKQTDSLPYSEAAISQELKFLEIKNKLRQQLKINPADFNIIGENLQLIILGYTIPFDSVNIRFIDDRIIVDGQYDKGILNASLLKDNVYFRAKNFSADFINLVLTSAKDGKKLVSGGTFSFDGAYRGGILNAAVEIQNTALIEFKSIQNIFALIDTVPSLFMFRDPHISAKGYQVNYGKVIFAINKDYIGLQNIFLLGSSMDINGQGIIDIDTQEMNVNLSISTIKNLSKFINKIPVIGYLILGREGQISTNLILSGKYVDPKVNITLAADIIKAPFNILRRVFPVEMLINSNRDEEEMILY